MIAIVTQRRKITAGQGTTMSMSLKANQVAMISVARRIRFRINL
jgi:hypothetical protein